MRRIWCESEIVAAQSAVLRVREFERQNVWADLTVSTQLHPLKGKWRVQTRSVMNVRNFFVELKRRNVYKSCDAYADRRVAVMQIAAQWFRRCIFRCNYERCCLADTPWFPDCACSRMAFELTPKASKRAEDVAPSVFDHPPHWKEANRANSLRRSRRSGFYFCFN